MRVMVGMSGGVDSSVAALLLQREDHAVAGMFMQNWEDEEPDSGCRADEDRKDALAVCAKLGIPFHPRNFAREYRERVFAHFLSEYRAGRTPNPDVLCNREIKFRTFLDAARELGAEKIATGHYARVEHMDGRWRLLRAADSDKDQTYFLHALDQQQLGAALFPLGELRKVEVRALARESGFAVHAKRDSTGICFIGERDFRGFLAKYLPAQPGELRTPEGEILGVHHGAMFYTPGQRAGLGLGGRAGAGSAPWYVVGKDVPSNVVYVAQGAENRWLMSQLVRAEQPHWIAGITPAFPLACSAMTRYRQPPQTCRVIATGDDIEVHFDLPQRAVAPGQSIVFYAGDECLGGGVITSTDAPEIAA
ncbi:MAG TPA: tRNA 2-thiouridine(34) synthase MnmA [Rhodanobacteraceae bacterium]|nr:tRNA 2-thiouridine(34) synthase MnmA [Rhodanobacteraceae bacterium]